MAATNVNAANSREEPGIVRFDVLQQQDDPRDSSSSRSTARPTRVAAHKATAHYATWRETVAPFMAEPRAGAAYTNVSPIDSAW